MKVALVLVAVWLALGPAVVADNGADPKYKVTRKRDDDTVNVQTDKDKVRFDIRSPKGISSATIERTEEMWPDTVVLRIHTRGLEGFWLSNGKVKLSGAVSVQAEGARFPLRMDEKEGKDTTWGEIVKIGSDGKPTQAKVLKDGYFEVQLPKAFFEGNPKTIEVSWIDFFRG